MNNYDRTLGYAKQLLNSASDCITSKETSAIAKVECTARTLCGLSTISYWYNDLDLFAEAGIWKIQTNYLDHENPLPNQALVEIAYLSLAFLRNESLWHGLAAIVQETIEKLVSQVGSIFPINNNWILFPAIVQLFANTFLNKKDVHKIVAAVNTMENWYRGDSIYSDGDTLQVDYYNSYVIHPMMMEIMTRMPELGYDLYLKRAQRYSVILENLIAPEGTYPIVGRSSTYRFGAFAHLSDMLRRKLLPKELDYAATCNALTAIIYRQMEGKKVFGGKNTTFDDRNILTIGAVGKQEQIAEYYISEGSSYLCCMGLSHLSVPKEDPMWNNPDANWTQQNIWSGKNDIVLAKGIKF